MKAFQQYIGDCLNVSIFDSGDCNLNYQCGPDYVKVLQKPPQVKGFYYLMDVSINN